MLSHLYWVTCCSCTSWVTADSAESSLKSRGLEPMRSEHDDRAIEDTVDAVRFQFISLDFVVITTVPLMAEEAVLEAVDMCYVYPNSWLELVKPVRRPRRGLE